MRTQIRIQSPTVGDVVEYAGASPLRGRAVSGYVQLTPRNLWRAVLATEDQAIAATSAEYSTIDDAITAALDLTDAC